MSDVQSDPETATQTEGRTRQELEHLCGVLAEGFSIVSELDEARGDPLDASLLRDDLYQLSSELDGRPFEGRRLQDSDPRWNEEFRSSSGFWPLGKPGPDAERAYRSRPRPCVEAAAALAVQISSMAREIACEPVLDLGGSTATQFDDLIAAIENAADEILVGVGDLLRQHPGDHVIVGEQELSDRDRDRLKRELEAETNGRTSRTDPHAGDDEREGRPAALVLVE